MLKLFVKLKKELGDIYQRIEDQAQQSNSFNVLKERYQSLSLLSQKLIKAFLTAVVVIAVLYLPLYYISSSTLSWLSLKEKHRLSLELLKAREKSSLSTMRDTEILLKNKINETIQKYSSEGFSLTQEPKKYPKSDFIEQIVFKARIPYLNIRQAIQLGTELEALSQARLEELTFTESEEYKNHYDVNYKLSAFVIKKDSHFIRRARPRRGVKKEETVKKRLKKKEEPSGKAQKNRRDKKNKSPLGLKSSQRVLKSRPKLNSPVKKRSAPASLPNPLDRIDSAAPLSGKDFDFKKEPEFFGGYPIDESADDNK